MTRLGRALARDLAGGNALDADSLRLQRLCPAYNVRSLCQDAFYLYFADWDGDIYKCAKSDGTVTLLDDSIEDTVTGMTLDSDYLYWTGAGGIYRIPLAGGTPDTMATIACDGIAQDANGVYFTQKAAGKLSYIEKVDETFAVVDLITDTVNPQDIAVDATNIYFIECTETTGKVRYVPLARGGIVDLVTGLNFPHCLAVGPVNVYYGGESTDGNVYSVPIAGGDPALLMEDSDQLDGLTLSDTDVYRVDGDIGGIVKTSLAGGIQTTIATWAMGFVNFMGPCAVDSDYFYAAATDGIYRIAR